PLRPEPVLTGEPALLERDLHRARPQRRAPSRAARGRAVGEPRVPCHGGRAQKQPHRELPRRADAQDTPLDGALGSGLRRPYRAAPTPTATTRSASGRSSCSIARPAHPPTRSSKAGRTGDFLRRTRRVRAPTHMLTSSPACAIRCGTPPSCASIT